MRQIRTDLAMESCDAAGGKLPGVHVAAWETSGVTITEVKVETEEGARLIGKPVGNYLTLECEGVRRRDLESRMAVGTLLGEEIARLLPAEEGPVLVVGLGNRLVTPDALGPKTVDRTLVTRHLFSELPHLTDQRMSPVCALAPGVLGVTGIETMELVHCVAQTVRPRAIIAVDALSARAVHRLCSTVQLTDTGIQPGSGVGNHRASLTRESLGIPVLALGIPTVIYAATLARDALEQIHPEEDEEKREKALDAVAQEMLQCDIGEMIVTPREVDDLINNAAAMLGDGINSALHPGLGKQDILNMML